MPTSGQRKILYYRNPMGLPDVSQAPKKDSMGMDYIPVYEGEEPDDGSTVKVSLEKVQRLGVVTAPAQSRDRFMGGSPTSCTASPMHGFVNRADAAGHPGNLQPGEGPYLAERAPGAHQSSRGRAYCKRILSIRNV